MTSYIKNIERGRQAPQGRISAEDDAPWEAYLQAHSHAEKLGLLGHDKELHDFLNGRLADFEEKYGVPIT